MEREKIEQGKIGLEMEEWEREKQSEIEREKIKHEKLRLEAEERIEIEKKNTIWVKMKELELQGNKENLN